MNAGLTLKTGSARPAGRGERACPKSFRIEACAVFESLRPTVLEVPSLLSIRVPPTRVSQAKVEKAKRLLVMATAEAMANRFDDCETLSRSIATRIASYTGDGVEELADHLRSAVVTGVGFAMIEQDPSHGVFGKKPTPSDRTEPETHLGLILKVMGLTSTSASPSSLMVTRYALEAAYFLEKAPGGLASAEASLYRQLEQDLARPVTGLSRVVPPESGGDGAVG